MTADDDVLFELSDRTPLQALASAYAARLGAIRAMADAAEIAESSEWIASLERMCLRGDGYRRHPASPGSAQDIPLQDTGTP